MRAMNPARVLLHMGPAYAKSCFRPLQVAGAYPENLRAIGERGHELGPHGNDHALWADRCYEMDLAETRREMVLAFEAYYRLLQPKLMAAIWRPIRGYSTIFPLRTSRKPMSNQFNGAQV